MGGRERGGAERRVQNTNSRRHRGFPTDVRHLAIPFLPAPTFPPSPTLRGNPRLDSRRRPCSFFFRLTQWGVTAKGRRCPLRGEYLKGRKLHVVKKRRGPKEEEEVEEGERRRRLSSVVYRLEKTLIAAMVGYTLFLLPAAANGSAPSFTPPSRPSSFCTECGELSAGPPPDSILAIPPPPLPSFLQRSPYQPTNPPATLNKSGDALAGWPRQSTDDIEELVASVLGNETSQCSLLCEWTSGGGGVEYVELPRQGPVIDDTWFLVLISSCIGVLLVGALLALLILKCRDDRNTKGSLTMDGSSSTTSSSTSTGSKAKVMMCGGGIGVVGGGGCGLIGGCNQGVPIGGGGACESILYPNGHHGTNRVLWAALTPRGTAAHFAVDRGTSVLPPISNLMRTQPNSIQMIQSQQQHRLQYIPNHHPSAIPPPPSHPPPPAPQSSIVCDPPVTAPINGTIRPHYGATEDLRNTQTESPEYATVIYAAPTMKNESSAGLVGHQQKLSFDNSGFIDSDDAPPEPPESYPLSDLEPTPTHTPNLEHRRNIRRPRVSSPTRIENPNLPPLNLMQHNRGGSGSGGMLGSSRRGMSTSSLRMRDEMPSPMA